MARSGYHAAAAAVVFSGTRTLQGLADDEYTHLSDEIDNSSNKYDFDDLYLDLASLNPTGVDAVVEIYLVPTVDGTTYPDWTGDGTTSLQQNEQWRVGKMVLATGSAVKDAELLNVYLPSGKFKYGVRNRANVAFAGSGNTLYRRPHSLS